MQLVDIIGLLSQLGGHHHLPGRDEGLRIVALHIAGLRFPEAAVRVGHIRGRGGRGIRKNLGGLRFPAPLLAACLGFFGLPCLQLALLLSQGFRRLVLQPGLAGLQARRLCRSRNSGGLSS